MKSHIDELKEQRYVPENSTELRLDQLDLVIYLNSNSHQKPCGICYEGRRKKNSFHLSFGSEEWRKKYCDDWVDGRQKEVDEKLAQQKLRKEFKTSLTAGDILSSSWGYDQTNVQFYLVTKVKSPKRVCLREVCKKLLDNVTGFSDMAGKVVPVPDSYVSDNEFEKLVTPGDTVVFSKYQRATKWDGKPQYCSWYA